jgi:dTDP-4-dehydrorhamnose reductase
MNILVTGSNGQLGSEIRGLESDFNDLNFFFKDASEVDICNILELETFVDENKIDSIINCAAYTAVDKAEEDSDISRKVNAEGVLNLVNVLEKRNGKLIHISTDYVFNGESFIPYKETDTVSPIGVYGNTKREGELSVLNSNIDGLVIRTSWLYSSFGNNFVKTMLRLGKDRDELGVIFDQVGTPTYARDLALTCLTILSKSKEDKISLKGKLYHYSNEGVASWYDFAKAIMFIGNINCNVKPIETKEYPTPAKRPHFSVLNKSKIKNDFEIKIPYWLDSLKECILELKKKK